MIWQRYLYKEILKVIFLSLFCFFLLFVVIDYSVHMRGFLRMKHLDLLMIAAYYGLQFIRHLDILFPLALLVASIKVLRSMSEKHELLALQAAGLPLKRIMRPFLVIASLAVAANFCMAEFLLPTSNSYAENFQTSYLKRPISEKSRLRVLELKDGSRLAFHSFDGQTATFHDLFWIRSTDDIWRIKSLQLDKNRPKEAPLCYFADHICRTQEGGLHKIESYEEIRLEPLKASSFQIKKSQISFENFSISKLFKMLQTNPTAEITAEVSMKCAKPFLSLLVVLAIAPFCLRFSRLSSAMPLYSLGIFGTIAYFVAIQAGGILTQNQILSPWLSIAAPLALLLCWSSLRFSKL